MNVNATLASDTKSVDPMLAPPADDGGPTFALRWCGTPRGLAAQRT